MTANITPLLVSAASTTCGNHSIHTHLTTPLLSSAEYEVSLLYLIFMSEPAVSRMGLPSAGLQ